MRDFYDKKDGKMKPSIKILMLLLFIIFFIISPLIIINAFYWIYEPIGKIILGLYLFSISGMTAFVIFEEYTCK